MIKEKKSFISQPRGLAFPDLYYWLSPAMISRVARFHCYKNAATSGGHLIVSNQLSFHHCTVALRFDNASYEFYWQVSRCRTLQFDCVFRSHRAGRMIHSRLPHQMPGGSPVAVTIEESAEDAAPYHASK